MTNLYKTSTFLLFSTFSLSVLAEDAKEINFDQLPVAVQKSVLNEVAKNNITKVELIHEEEATKYEIESKTNGVAKDVTLASNGSIIEIEQGSSLSQLSPSALEAIKHDYPDLKIDEIESVQSFYTAVEGTVKGKKVAFKVLATGDIEGDDNSKEESKD
jgi:hypothetical protein